ncbi:unnamed protein product, partial [Polarella glacialis]
QVWLKYVQPRFPTYFHFPKKRLAIASVDRMASRILMAFLFLQVLLVLAADWEPLDEDFDIMALMGDEEPGAISMIQQDSRLQYAAAECVGGICPDDILAPQQQAGAGLVLLQMDAKYKFGQPVGPAL